MALSLTNKHFNKSSTVLFRGRPKPLGECMHHVVLRGRSPLNQRTIDVTIPDFLIWQKRVASSALNSLNIATLRMRCELKAILTREESTLAVSDGKNVEQSVMINHYILELQKGPIKETLLAVMSPLWFLYTKDFCQFLHIAKLMIQLAGNLSP